MRRSVSDRTVVEIEAHGVLDVPEAIAAELLAAKPACNYNNVVAQPLPLEHANDHLAGPGLAIIIFDGR